ncbi:MAG TPA: S1/P1 nuclease [Chthoniobacterales bacterium]|nr:S1/P1 nuclease [Chthoniobacterales bacterium]
MRASLILAAAFCCACGFAGNSYGYGPIGHQVVGGIADERLKNTPQGQQVRALLQGISLRKASVIPDEIKSWDKKSPDDPKALRYRRTSQVDADLVAFWKANPPTKEDNSPIPSHHWFHYTDVPLVRPEKYEDGDAGRSKWDIVHMTAYCVDVLRGRIPEENERKITKRIAVILLAHFLGDIHQPLHVGAHYFDKDGNVVDPAKVKDALVDDGGNTLNLELNDDPPRGRGMRKRMFHTFWDNDTVMGLLPYVPEETSKDDRKDIVDAAINGLIRDMAAQEPANWKAPNDLDPARYAQYWANDILPLAAEAHQRLDLKRVAPRTDEDRVVAAGDIVEKPGSPPGEYRKWAIEIVRKELHKGGWRLADLLEKSLAPPPAMTPTMPQSTAAAAASPGNK